jgi:hypothetical protein
MALAEEKGIHVLNPRLTRETAEFKESAETEEAENQSKGEK